MFSHIPVQSGLLFQRNLTFPRTFDLFTAYCTYGVIGDGPQAHDGAHPMNYCKDWIYEQSVFQFRPGQRPTSESVQFGYAKHLLCLPLDNVVLRINYESSTIIRRSIISNNNCR